jgi:hypothetical protein
MKIQNTLHRSSIGYYLAVDAGLQRCVRELPDGAGLKTHLVPVSSAVELSVLKT